MGERGTLMATLVGSIPADSKPWYNSKTVWFNVVYAVSALAAVALSFSGYNEYQPDARLVEGIGLASAILNLILRLYFTNKAIG